MTIKLSNINLTKTHLDEGCQAPLFRFKDECGKEKSLVELNGRNYNLYFSPKDFAPSCILSCGDSSSIYIHSDFAGRQPAPVQVANLFKILILFPGKRSFIDLNLVNWIKAGISGIRTEFAKLFSNRNL